MCSQAPPIAPPRWVRPCGASPRLAPQRARPHLELLALEGEHARVLVERREARAVGVEGVVVVVDEGLGDRIEVAHRARRGRVRRREGRATEGGGGERRRGRRARAEWPLSF